MSLSNPSQPSTPTVAHSSASISHPAHSLLRRAHSPETSAQIFTDKIRNKPLLLQPTNYGDSKDQRALRRHIRERKKAYHRSKQRPRPLSAREKREKGIYDLTPDECRYDIYQGLHRLWTGYVLEILGFTDSNGKVDRAKVQRGTGVSAVSQGSVLATMDFHGMEVEVVRCRDVGRVGLKGIVVRETKYSFVVVCPGDKVRRVMKGGTVFRVEVQLPGLDLDEDTEQGDTVNDKNKTSARKLVFELHGDQIEIRPIERAVKKFKWKTMDHL